MLLRTLVACCGLALASLPATAARTVTFANYGAWHVYASFDDANQFSFCAAMGTYKSGTRFSIIYYRKQAQWALQFYHSGWPDRTGNTPAVLSVDGRELLRSSARFFKQSVFVDLGPSIDRVKLLMKGNNLSVATSSGSSSFSLRGSSGATIRVAQCLKKHMATGIASGGAFGSGPAPSASSTQPGSGAFGTPGTQPVKPQPNPASKAQMLSRAETLDHALSYLNQNKLSYKLLPANASYFKNFPVNWSYGPKSYGGMMIIRNPAKSGADQLGGLLGDQARLCSEKSATARKPVQEDGKSRVHRATGACLSEGQQFALHYTVVDSQANATQFLIIEMIHAGDAGATPGIAKEKEWRIDKIEYLDRL